MYFDANASRSLVPAAIEIMEEFAAMQQANPSSLHRQGQFWRARLEHSRRHIAQWLDTEKDNVIFTSGGTEANNLGIWQAIGPALMQKKPTEVVASKIFHPSIVQCLEHWSCFGIEVHWITPDENGILNPNDYIENSNENTVLWVMEMVNSEHGVIQDIDSFAHHGK